MAARYFFLLRFAAFFAAFLPAFFVAFLTEPFFRGGPPCPPKPLPFMTSPYPDIAGLPAWTEGVGLP